MQINTMINKLFYSIVLIISLNTYAISATTTSKIQQIWQIEHFPNIQDNEIARLKNTLDFTHLPKVNAYLGCNDVNFDVQLTKNTIQFTQFISTLKYCFNDMDLEDSFTQIANDITHYTFQENGKILILSTKSGKKIQLRAISSKQQ